MRSHHAKTVTEYLDKAGIHYAYLPPYSPDLNPIEKMWSKMKAILRKQKVRVASELPEAVKKALEMIRHTDWIVRGGSMRVDICTNLWNCYSPIKKSVIKLPVHPPDGSHLRGEPS